jgi:TolA-binding protein
MMFLRFALGLTLALALAVPKSMMAIVTTQTSLQRSNQQNSNEQRIIQAQREDRDQAEQTDLDRRLIAEDIDEVTGLTAIHRLRDCQQKRRLTEEARSSNWAATPKLCIAPIQQWSMSGSQSVAAAYA